MKKHLSQWIVTISILASLSSMSGAYAKQAESVVNSLPAVFPAGMPDLTTMRIKNEAAHCFSSMRLPDTLEGWREYREALKVTIARSTGALLNQELALDMQVTCSFQAQGYTVKNLIYQSQPGIYTTANLFIPDGKGPFPGVLVMAGHNLNGRMGSQFVGYTLAVNGYVALAVDPWGSGERTTEHGNFEYHGATLGASLMNVGKSLMGMHITDNMRGVDLLYSLEFVDKNRVGATGASGGGNQTMWIAAMDERIKAAVPVVSVGTFESYVMGHNCVCEVLIDGLAHTEEAGILALVAPRALMPSNGLKDSNGAFQPAEMLRSYTNALPIYQLYEATEAFQNHVYDGPHGYRPPSMEAMLHFFNQHLKGMTKKSPQVELLERGLYENEKLMVFEKGKRTSRVCSTAEFCRRRGSELRIEYLKQEQVKCSKKQDELRQLLRINEFARIVEVNTLSPAGGWERISLLCNDNKLIPLLCRAPAEGCKAYTILAHADGKGAISEQLLESLIQQGHGVAVVDLSGVGEAWASSAKSNDRLAKLHTLARSYLWLGKRTLGEWVKELEVVADYLRTNHNAAQIYMDGSKEAGIAALFLGALDHHIHSITLRDAPVSYIFDKRETVDFFSLGIHLPGFLLWGDLSLAAGLNKGDVRFINPVTMSGNPLDERSSGYWKSEYQRMRRLCKTKGKTML